MRTYKLTIAYDGGEISGVAAPGHDGQYDPVRAGVKHRQISGMHRVHVDGSGRTDAGVHARGQVASVKLSKLYDTKELKDSLNRYLPEDIRDCKSRTCKERISVPAQAQKGKNMSIILTAGRSRMYSRAATATIIRRSWISRQ